MENSSITGRNKERVQQTSLKVGETKMNNNHLHSKRIPSLSTAVTDMLKCKGKHRTAQSAQALTWKYWPKNGEIRVGKKLLSFSSRNDRLPHLLF